MVAAPTRYLADADFALGGRDEADLRALSTLLAPVRKAAGDF